MMHRPWAFSCDQIVWSTLHNACLPSILLPDFDYLRRKGERDNPALLVREPKFLGAQHLFFSVVELLGGTVDFDIADMREVHAIAALGNEVIGKRILDIGCGSTEPYVLGDNFRDLYPPYFAEMLVQMGVQVTGVDIRTNPTARYDHRVLDCTMKNWKQSLAPPYDLIACFSLFNAPKSLFEQNALLCDHVMKDMRSLLSTDGLLIVTLRDDLFAKKASKEQVQNLVRRYVESQGFELMHLDLNTAWAKPL